MRWTYEPKNSIPDVAACYGLAWPRIMPWWMAISGSPFSLSGIFLRMNGYRLAADRAEAAVVMEDVAAGQLDEQGSRRGFKTTL